MASNLVNTIVSFFDDDDNIIRSGVVVLQFMDEADYDNHIECVLIKTPNVGEADWIVPISDLFDENDEVETFEKCYKWFSED